MSAALHNNPARSDAEKLEAAAVMFNEVANLAAELVRLMNLAIDDGEEGAAARALAAQVGFIADAGADGCGGRQVMGGAVEWLLSPAAADAANSLQASARMETAAAKLLRAHERYERKCAEAAALLPAAP